MTETERTAPAPRAAFRATAFARDGRWHLEISSLDSEPDTGDTEAVLVTLRPTGDAQDGTRFPADGLREQLRRNGFVLDDPDAGTGGWTRVDDEERYTAMCRPTTRAV
ncbi:hypothetical protein ACFU90_05245 [Streptomyces noursei]|uniref:Uncharacterized protein n=1 Tax=Streptomyces noursei TaxID=1971 RepID=A0A059WF24_STRNR|nr:hypothetical protein [Streptomyces noursei]AKA09233.1 hypothetical protein SAZ_41135 [Streptomyces noursei ZPM]AIA08375.1 hypothetical protein DC74_7967 [Streptomyces noursei]EOS99089.1 hypothetical protein K530_35698 [Streptomyces noursei CCRC 11814]EXU89376.1 hypothetical protein P354_23300 [Streptomyces noursei PD-1]UWS76670.1 hypothetical protein N1H47_38740 [Streptomyces noursei]